MNSNLSTDPLMQCLIILTKLNNRPTTVEALSHGLPFDSGEEKQRLFSLYNSKSNFSRAAANAGFKATLVKRSIGKISPLVLPAILLLKNDTACVLTAMDHKAGVAEVIMPGVNDAPMEIPLNRLEEEHLGFAYFLQKIYQGYREDTSTVSQGNRKRWFFGTLWRFRSIYMNVLLATLLVNLFVIAGPLFTMNVYDRVIPHNAVDTLWVLAIGVFIIYSFDLVLKFIRAYFLEIAAKKSDVILSSMLFEQAMNIRMGDKPRSVGSFANNIREFDSIRSFYASSAITAFIELPFAVIFLLIIYTINQHIVIIPVVAMFFIIAYSLLMRRTMHNVIASTHEASAKRSGLLIEALSNLETIKAFNASSGVQWHWEESTGDISNKSLKSRILSTSLSSVAAFMTQVCSMSIVVLGVYLIKEGELTMGGLIATVMLSARTIAPMSQVASLLSSFEQMRTGLSSLNDLMQKDVERPENKHFLRRPVFEGGIEFKDLSFSYPGEETSALSSVSFKLEPKERVGIIGQVGSGKSTISKLLLGFYDGSAGSVFVDGIDIKQIDPADLRHNFSYVPQEIALFSGTVRENVTFKAPYSDDEDILRAVDIGCVNNLTDRHPMGLDLPVGERGSNLSGGQRQSVAVSRAFLTDSPIVLLDEPTNSMDSTTERKVINNLKEVTKGKTTIVITHKPSILEIVDRIILMDKGKVILDGPKEEVLAKLGGGK